MKIYIVTYEFFHESKEIEGVFSKFEDAFKYFNEIIEERGYKNEDFCVHTEIVNQFTNNKLIIKENSNCSFRIEEMNLL